jgi:hypothetical protein
VSLFVPRMREPRRLVNIEKNYISESQGTANAGLAGCKTATSA